MQAVNIVIVSHYEDSRGDADFEAKSVDQYDSSNPMFTSLSQGVISFFESRGYCLDAGGDDTTAEWDIADPNPFECQSKAENAANAVLRALERKLVQFKV